MIPQTVKTTEYRDLHRVMVKVFMKPDFDGIRKCF